MKILAISDEEDPYLWSLGRENHPHVDLILSCGDLESAYLQYLVTIFNCPLLYVHGNHDTHYAERPPEGCTCIEDMVYEFRGVRILGLGGSFRYRQGEHMHTEREMKQKYLKAWRFVKRHQGFDILLTHAPSYAFGDQENLSHRGFVVFDKLIDRYRPAYHIHGHIHLSYGSQNKRISEYQSGTKEINAYGKYCLETGDSIQIRET